VRRLPGPNSDIWTASRSPCRGRDSAHSFTRLRRVSARTRRRLRQPSLYADPARCPVGMCRPSLPPANRTAVWGGFTATERLRPARDRRAGLVAALTVGASTWQARSQRTTRSRNRSGASRAVARRPNGRPPHDRPRKLTTGWRRSCRDDHPLFIFSLPVAQSIMPIPPCRTAGQPPCIGRAGRSRKRTAANFPRRLGWPSIAT